MGLLFLIVNLTIKNHIGIAGDYSNQRYTVTDTTTRDTSDSNSEIRTFWSFQLDSGKQLQTDNSLDLSTTSLRDRLNLTYHTNLNRLIKLTTAADGELRYDHGQIPIGNPDFLPQSYFNSNLRLSGRFQPVENFSTTISENLELHRDFSIDSFSYNYLINRTGIGVTFSFSGLSQWAMNYNYHRLWAQNQSGRNYLEHILTLDWDNYLGVDWHLVLNTQFCRRSYSDRMRSYWEGAPSLSLSWFLNPALELMLKEDLRLSWFDETTSVYQNQVENRGGLEFETRGGEFWTLRFGPEVEFTHSLPRITDQDYREITFLLGVDLFKSSRFWVSVDDRLGERRYLFADSGFQSDYRFNEFSFFCNWDIITSRSGGLSLQIMASIAPEWHREAIDNLAATTGLLELKYSW
ncbi:MAG: hypothetical protein ACUVUR_03740 [bacterium]